MQMSEALLKLARLSVEKFVKEDAAVGRVPLGSGAGGSGGPGVPSEVAESNPQHIKRTPQAIIHDAIEMLQEALREKPEQAGPDGVLGQPQMMGGIEQKHRGTLGNPKVNTDTQHEIYHALMFMLAKSDTPISVKCVLKDDNGRTLLLRDNQGPWWGLPGGHVKEGESIDDALKREVKEETDLEITNLHSVDTRMLDLGSMRPVIFYEAEVMGGVPRISDEHIGMLWAGDEDLGSMNLGVFKDYLIPSPRHNEVVEGRDPIATPAAKGATGPMQIPRYARDGDGGGAVEGVDNVTESEDTHTDTYGSTRRFKSLTTSRIFYHFLRHMKGLRDKSVGSGQLVTGDAEYTAQDREVVERPVHNTKVEENIHKGEKLRVIKAKYGPNISKAYIMENYGIHVINKAYDGDGDFIVAGYASPVVVDKEGHKVSHEALEKDLSRFMGQGGRYANVNLLHCLVPDTPVVVERGGPGCKKTFKPIHEIGVGDKVYTHKGRKRTVEHVATMFKDEDIVRLSLDNGEVVRITDDHAVLTTDGWVPAGELNMQHILMHSKKTRADDQRVRRGELILANGVRILDITREHYTGTMHCLNVADDHSYVGNGIVFHNSNVTVGEIIPEYTSTDGKTYKTEVDNVGLYVVAKLRTDKDAPKIVGKVIDDIVGGNIRSFSISGDADNPKMVCDDERCWYDIADVELYEITLCHKGVNQDAKFNIVAGI